MCVELNVNLKIAIVSLSIEFLIWNYIIILIRNALNMNRKCVT